MAPAVVHSDVGCNASVPDGVRKLTHFGTAARVRLRSAWGSDLDDLAILGGLDRKCAEAGEHVGADRQRTINYRKSVRRPASPRNCSRTAVLSRRAL
jgi:hypothetical protein